MAIDRLVAYITIDTDPQQREGVTQQLVVGRLFVRKV